MTVKEYKSKLNKQLKILDQFKSKTDVVFSDNHFLDLPNINMEMMKYNESNTKTKYRAVNNSGEYASSCNNMIIEYDSIDRLANSIAYNYHRSSFELRVKEHNSKIWRKPSSYESRIFNKKLDNAFMIDEWH